MAGGSGSFGQTLGAVAQLTQSSAEAISNAAVLGVLGILGSLVESLKLALVVAGLLLRLELPCLPALPLDASRGAPRHDPGAGQEAGQDQRPQAQTLAGFASEQVQAAIWISLFTGCRRGEILALKAEDIGRDNITIQAGNTKTLRTRTVPIIAPVRPWLKFVPLQINFEGLKSGFRRAREAAGMPEVTFHDLRRSCGTMLIQQGVELHVVSRLLGHTSTTVTEKVYAHLNVKQLKEGLGALEDLHRDLHRRPQTKSKRPRRAAASA